jgi:hypothetical protein
MSSLSPKSKVAGYEHAIAGFGAGATATLLTYPLDLLRTRFQGIFLVLHGLVAVGIASPNVHRSPPGPVMDLKHVSASLRYKSVWHAVTNIIRLEGPQGTILLLHSALDPPLTYCILFTG